MGRARDLVWLGHLWFLRCPVHLLEACGAHRHSLAHPRSEAHCHTPVVASFNCSVVLLAFVFDAYCNRLMVCHDELRGPFGHVWLLRIDSNKVSEECFPLRGLHHVGTTCADAHWHICNR